MTEEKGIERTRNNKETSPRSPDATVGYFPLALSAGPWSLRRSVDFSPNEAIPSEIQRNPISANTASITTVTMSPTPSANMGTVHASYQSGVSCKSNN
jgi:hypothetical protein